MLQESLLVLQHAKRSFHCQKRTVARNRNGEYAYALRNSNENTLCADEMILGSCDMEGRITLEHGRDASNIGGKMANPYAAGVPVGVATGQMVVALPGSARMAPAVQCCSYRNHNGNGKTVLVDGKLPDRLYILRHVCGCRPEEEEERGDDMPKCLAGRQRKPCQRVGAVLGEIPRAAAV